MKETKNFKQFNKKEIIYSAIVEKELLHNWIVQKELLKNTKALYSIMQELTTVLKWLESNEYFKIHKSKWKILLYNLSLWILFAIWTVMWLLFLSWSTYHFFKDSEILKNIIESQLKIRQFDMNENKK